MGFLDAFKLSRLKEGLAKTRDNLFGKVQKILSSKSKIDDELLDNLEEVLIAGDVGVTTAMKIIDRIKERVKQDRYEHPSELDYLLRDEIQKVFVNGSSTENEPFTLPADHRPHVIMIVGVNGVGKTTTIGKLAYNYRTAGKKVLISAADTFRAAANEQLEIWAKRAGVEIIQQRHGADPAAVAFDSLKSAISKNADVMIIDTAGRLHTKINLMEELRKIKRVLQKQLPEAPHEVLLVLRTLVGFCLERLRVSLDSGERGSKLMGDIRYEIGFYLLEPLEIGYVEHYDYDFLIRGIEGYNVHEVVFFIRV